MPSRSLLVVIALITVTSVFGCAVQKADDQGFGDAGTFTDDTANANTEDTGVTTPEDTGVTTPEDTGVTTPEDTGVTTPEDTGVTTPEDTGSIGMTDTGSIGATDTGSPGTVDVPSCSSGQSLCSGVCVSLQTSRENCGFCGNVCAAGRECLAGTCALRCTSGQIECSGGCVNSQVDNANCGACGRACASGQTCQAGACACPSGRTLCSGVCAALQTDIANCGACGVACTRGASCSSGRCVGGTVGGTPFRMSAFLSTGCRVADHNSLTGDDRGGVAVSGQSFFVTGDTSTARLDPDSLSGVAVGSIYDSLVSNLETQQVFVLATSDGLINNLGGTAVALQEINGTTGAPLTGRRITLSMPITLPSYGAGIFSGWGRAVILASGRAYHIDLSTGTVLDLGAVAMPSIYRNCENWAVWGVAEYDSTGLSVVYVESTTAIARMRIPERTVTRVSTFTNLGDMCSITVSPQRRRWYFHHEYSSQFGGDTSGETAGYCDASFTGPVVPCAPGLTLCGDRCVNLQTDTTQCGRCGNTCASGHTCVSGTCACAPGQTLCNGSCVDTQTSTAHCGGCENACVSGQLCTAGVCNGGRRYARSTPVDPPVFVSACSASGRQNVLTDTDDGVYDTTLPFAFRWWGNPLAAGTHVAVSSNGYLTMNTPPYWPLSGVIPSTTTPNDVVAPQWRDLVTSDTGVCIATVGTSPSRRWVVEWLDTRHFGNSNSLTFEVVFHETSSVIEFMYGLMSGASGTTVGLEDASGTTAVGGCPDGSTSCTIGTNYRVQFVPAP